MHGAKPRGFATRPVARRRPDRGHAEISPSAGLPRQPPRRPRGRHADRRDDRRHRRRSRFAEHDQRPPRARAGCEWRDRTPDHGLRFNSAGLQHGLLVLHRAQDARRRTLAPDGRHRGRVPGPRRARRARSHVARSDCDELRASRLSAYGGDFALRAVVGKSLRPRRHRTHPLHVPPPSRFQRRFGGGVWPAPETLWLRAPADAERQQPHPPRDEPPLHPRALQRDRRRPARGAERHVFFDGCHRGFSWGDRRRFSADARALRGRQLRHGLCLQILDPHRHARGRAR